MGACSDDGEKTIKIGAAVSETGRYAEEGEHTRQGYRLWEDWVNKEYGGVKVGDESYKVQLVMYDDGSDPDSTAELVEQLIDEDEVDFLLGPYSSTLTQRAIEVADARGMILVEGSGASETLFRESYQNLFAVMTPAGSYTQSALRALGEMGARSVVIVHADDLFPASVAEGAERWAGEYGLEVLRVESYPRDATDVTDILSELKELDPDDFVGGGYFDDALLFVRTAKELDFNPKAMVLTVGPTDPDLMEELGEDANYLIGPTQWEASMSYQGDYFGSASDYAERYAAKWGGPPAYQSASATAAALALQLAIEAAARWTPMPCGPPYAAWTRLPSTAGSASTLRARTRPSPWGQSRYRTAISAWWRLPTPPLPSCSILRRDGRIGKDPSGILRHSGVARV